MSTYEIVHGDALHATPSLAPRSVQTCVTSPPYYGLRDYGLPPTEWPAMSYAPMAGLPALVIPPMECCLGLEPTVEAYIGHLVLIFRGVRDALREDGTAFLNLGDSYAGAGAGGGGNRKGNEHGQHDALVGSNRGAIPTGLKPKDLIGIPWRAAFALQADGWWLRQDIIWHKPNPMPESVTDRCTKAHEYIFLLAKSASYYYDHEAIKEASVRPGDVQTFGGDKGRAYQPERGDPNFRNGKEQWGRTVECAATRNKRSVWTVSTKPYAAAHFAAFNPELIEPCILAGTSERGACPACGAGWARVVEKGERVRQHWEGTEQTKAKAAKGKHGATSVIETGFIQTYHTIGWEPSCKCDAGEPVPAVVLDIFAGTSATGEAALRNGRRYIGIEASAFNVQLSHDRLAPIARELRGEFRPRVDEASDLAALPLFNPTP